MSLRSRWSEDQIKSLLTNALAGGEDLVYFETLDDAEKFRFACYNLRQRKQVGLGLSFILNKDPISILIKLAPTYKLVEIDGSRKLQRRL